MPSIHYLRRIAPLAAAVVCAAVLSACNPHDPAQLQAWYDLNPEHGENVTADTLTDEQRAVLRHIEEQQRAWLTAVEAQRDSGDCYVEMRKVFPASTWSAMTTIIHRESRGNPRAQNPSSTAAGCTQMLRMHAHRFDAVGCSWARRYEARCNLRAAHHLYREAGLSPWRLTYP